MKQPCQFEYPLTDERPPGIPQSRPCRREAWRTTVDGKHVCPQCWVRLADDDDATESGGLDFNL